MKFSLDDVLESGGPFVILTVDKHNELKGKVGTLERQLESAEASNKFLQQHIRKLEEKIDGQQLNTLQRANIIY